MEISPVAQLPGIFLPAMRNISHFILLMTLPTLGWAQNPYDKYYANLDSTNGKHTFYHSNGQVGARFTILNKHLQDTLFEYDTKGRLYSVAVYNQGRFHGEGYQLDNNDRLYTWLKFTNDTLLEARFYSYHKNDTLKWLTISVSSRNIVFPYLHYSREQKTQINLDIPGYLKHSRSKDSIVEFYNNGKIKTIYHYIGDKANGLQQKFHREGWKTYEANYTQDKLNGEVLYFDQEGNIIRRETRVMGKKVK